MGADTVQRDERGRGVGRELVEVTVKRGDLGGQAEPAARQGDQREFRGRGRVRDRSGTQPCRAFDETCGVESGQRCAQRFGCGGHHGVELVRGLRPGFHCAAPSDLQEPDRFYATVGGFGRAARFATQGRASGADRVGRVGLAVTTAMLTVRAMHLDDANVLRCEEAGESGTPCAGAFDPDQLERPETAKPTEQLSVAGGRCRERLGAERAAEFVNRGRDVNVFVGVDATRDPAR